MRRTFFICSALILFAASVSAQKDKPWTEWTEKDAAKVLTDSAWSQTQKEMSDVAPSSGTSGSAVTRAGENGNSANMVMGEAAKNASESGQNVGQKSGSLTVNYYVSFLTAKPVRQAFVRMIELKTPNTPPDKVAERRTFVERDFGDYVIVTLKLEGTDKKKLDPARQFLSTADLNALKATTYLERKDGKRLALMDYRAPSPESFGAARLIFPRNLEGKPFIDSASGEVRVYIELGKAKVIRRFKVADMMYDGKLEY
ncbi:MAG TPA: hypothetical protein DC054_20945 [Blastocatellia bacterium]|nr:hypothetical protein [Blastocatellia bacterium]